MAENFFEAFGASIVSGRAFSAADVELNRPVAIVDQAFVQHVLNGRNPIGQWVRQPQNSENATAGPWHEIVGVVADLSNAPAKISENAVLYLPISASAMTRTHVAVQLEGDAEAFAPRLRRIAADADPTLRLYDVMGLDQVNLADQLAAGFFMPAFALVSSVALMLSMAGVYSMMAFAVARRTREIGIRAAIGADRWQILTAIFSRAFGQVGLGVALGSLPGCLIVLGGAPEAASGSGSVIAILALLGVSSSCSLSPSLPVWCRPAARFR